MSGTWSDKPADGRCGNHARARGTRWFPEVTVAFWLSLVLASASGEIGGQAVIQGIGLSPWGVAVAIVPICLLGVAALPAARRRYPRAAFWGAIAVLTVAATVFAETVDTSLGVGDLPASLQVAALLLLAIVLDYRLADMVALPFDNWSHASFFWVTACLAQTFASALVDWASDPGGPGFAAALTGLSIALPTIVVLHQCRIGGWRVQFWLAFVLCGAGGALTGEVLRHLAGIG